MTTEIALSRSTQSYVAALLLILTGLAFSDRQAVAASNEQDYFHDCVKQEFPAVLRRFVIANGSEVLNPVEESTKAVLVNDLFSICKQRAIDSSHTVDERSFVDDAVGSFIKEIPRATALQRQLEQQWKSDPSQAIEDQAARSYFLCIMGTARRLARTSDEATDTIEQASLKACEKNRQTVFDTYSNHNKTYDPEAVMALEQKFHSEFPDVVTKTRNDMRKATQR